MESSLATFTIRFTCLTGLLNSFDLATQKLIQFIATFLLAAPFFSLPAFCWTFAFSSLFPAFCYHWFFALPAFFQPFAITGFCCQPFCRHWTFAFASLFCLLLSLDFCFCQLLPAFLPSLDFLLCQPFAIARFCLLPAFCHR